MANVLSGKEVGERAYAEFLTQKNTPDDPSPWYALNLDHSLPMDIYAKATYLKDCSGWSRQFLLPIVRPFARLMIMLIQVLKVFIPNKLHSSKLLHYLIYVGQEYFVSPEANFIILRHFHLGSQILKFLAYNIKNAEISLKVISPTKLRDIYTEEIYLNHDINLYNFIIQLNESLRKSDMKMDIREPLSFEMITQGDFDIQGLRDTWLNFIDVETAIEIYTPIFQLLLRDSDFWRAHHSLQFDETIALYVAQVLKNPHHLGLVNNKHPLAPMSGTAAAYRLLLHGISSELLHGMLAQRKYAAAEPGRPIPLEYPS